MDDLDPDAIAEIRNRLNAHYGNKSALVQIMMNLGYIDVIASGIQRIFSSQIARCMPLPDYDLTDPSRVKVTLYGSELNKTYTQIMAAHPDMPISLARILDNVQKGLSITEGQYEQARASGFQVCITLPCSPALA